MIGFLLDRGRISLCESLVREEVARCSFSLAIVERREDLPQVGNLCDLPFAVIRNEGCMLGEAWAYGGVQQTLNQSEALLLLDSESLLLREVNRSHCEVSTSG